MLLLGLGVFDEAEKELREVADDDEGRGQGGAAVVLHYQVVPLELPENIRVTLHNLESVAIKKRNKGLISARAVKTNMSLFSLRT